MLLSVEEGFSMERIWPSKHSFIFWVRVLVLLGIASKFASELSENFKDDVVFKCLARSLCILLLASWDRVISSF